MTPEAAMIVPITLTFAGADTQNSLWIPCMDYTRVGVSGYWTGSINCASVDLQGTNDPPVAGTNYQPSPDAVDIFPIVSLTNTVPGGTASTAGTWDPYMDLAARFLRVTMTETDTEAGTLVLKLLFRNDC